MPTKPTAKSSNRCSSGKFIAWNGFILATFALAGVIVVVADKAACEIAVPTSVIQAKKIASPEKVASELSTPTQSQPSLQEATIQNLEFQVSILREYVIRLGESTKLDWPVYSLRAGQGTVWGRDFVYPPFPILMEKTENSVYLAFEQPKVALSTIEVSIDVTSSAPVLDGCDLTEKHAGLEYVVCRSVNGGMETWSDNPSYINLKDGPHGEKVVTTFTFNGPSLRRHCEGLDKEYGGGYCEGNAQKEADFKQLVNKILDSVEAGEFLLAI